MTSGAGASNPEGVQGGRDLDPEAPLRVAFFSPQTSEYKAAGLWCALPAARGAEFGIEGRCFAAPLPGLFEGCQRIFAGNRALGRIAWAAYLYLIMLPLRVAQLLGLWRFDVVFVNLSMFKIKSRPTFEALAGKLFRKPVVFHISDAYWVRFPRQAIEERCRMAELVVTGNQTTAEFVESAGGTIRKVEYGLEVDLYPAREHAGTRDLVIGFTGTGADAFPSEAAEGIARACDEAGARLVYVGGTARPDIPALNEVMEWRAWDERNPQGFFREFDLAVCPLEEDEWTRGKETFKVKEYMAAGLPQVLSPVGYALEVVEDGVEGFFANSSEEWFERLMTLIGDPSLRGRMGAAARLKIETSYGTDRMLAGIASVCREAYEAGRS